MPHRPLPRTVFLLGLTSLFTDIGTEMIFPLLPAFLALELGAGATFLGLVEGAANAVASVLKLVAGEISDRIGRRKPLVVFGYGLAGAIRPLVALAGAPWHVLVIRVTDRVGKGVRGAPRDALIAEAAHEGEAGRAFGFHEAMDHTGAVVGPLLAAGLLALGLGYRSVFALAAVPGVLALWMVLTVKEPPVEPRVKRTAKVEGSPAAPHQALPRRLLAYLGILAVFALGNSSDAFLLLRAKELGIDGAELPLLWAAFHVVKVASSSWAGALSDRVPRVRLILGGWAVYALVYLLFGLADAAWQIWALFVVYGAYFGLSEPAEKALVKDLAPGDLRGRAYGAYNFIVGIAALPAGVLTGWVWQVWGAAYALGLGALLAGGAALMLAVWQPAAARE